MSNGQLKICPLNQFYPHIILKVYKINASTCQAYVTLSSLTEQLAQDIDAVLTGVDQLAVELAGASRPTSLP